MDREYGVDNGDGTVTVWGTDDAGGFWPIRTESMAVNQGQAPASTASPVAPAGGFTGTGGAGYIDPYLQGLQQQYLTDRLNRVEVPTLDLARAQNDWQRMQAYAGLTGYLTTGQSPTMSTEAALDYIASARPDVISFHASNGWASGSPDEKRRIVQNWLTYPEHQGKTAFDVAAALGADTGGTGGAQTPTMAREQWMADLTGKYGGQDTMAREQWLANKALQEGGLTGTYGGQDTLEKKRLQAQDEQFYAGLRGQLSGPSDWIKYQQVQPSAAFGTIQATPSWESAGVGAASNRDWWQRAVAGSTGQAPSAGGSPGQVPSGVGQIDSGAILRDMPRYEGGSGQVVAFGGAPSAGGGFQQTFQPLQEAYQSPYGPVRQPHQISAQDYNRMTDTDKQMQEGLWSAQGVRPADAWQRMRAAAPTGTASGTTRWT